MLELIKTTTNNKVITIIIEEALHHISVPKSIPNLVSKSEYQSQKNSKSEYQSQKSIKIDQVFCIKTKEFNHPKTKVGKQNKPRNENSIINAFT